VADNNVHEGDVRACCWQERMLDNMKKEVDQTKKGEVDGEPEQ
jgi:hypothetical protein